MDFFDKLKDKAMDLTQVGVAKSKQLAEIAKLKGANLAEEDAIKKAYIEIGKLYYAERSMAPDAAYAALCEKITAAKVNIEENKSRIEAIKATAGEEAEEVEPIVVVDAEAEEPAVEVEPLHEETPVEPVMEDETSEEE